jgi:hypothetical protein
MHLRTQFIRQLSVELRLGMTDPVLAAAAQARILPGGYAADGSMLALL